MLILLPMYNVGLDPKFKFVLDVDVPREIPFIYSFFKPPVLCSNIRCVHVFKGIYVCQLLNEITVPFVVNQIRDDPFVLKSTPKPPCPEASTPIKKGDMVLDIVLSFNHTLTLTFISQLPKFVVPCI